MRADLHLSLFNALRDGGPDVALVLPQRVFGLNFRQRSDRVLLGLVANIGGQRDDRVDHVVPVLSQPGDRVRIPAVVQRHLDVFSCVA